MSKISGFLMILLVIFLNPSWSSEGKTTAANAKISDQASIVLLKQSNERPSKRVSREIRDHAKCILVFPQVIKRGLLVVGDQKGEGLVSCRLQENTWSAPLYVYLKAGTWGLQAGIQDASIVLFLLHDSAVEELLNPSVKLGTNFDFIAGPVGRSSKVKNQPPVISYVRTSGLFAGLDIEKVRVDFMANKNKEVYGKGVMVKKILTQPRQVPDRFFVFLSTLTDYAPIPAN